LAQLVGDPNKSYTEVVDAGIPLGLSHIPWAKSESKQFNIDKLGVFIQSLERFKDEVEEDRVRLEPTRAKYSESLEAE
jgi:hypothetical protein